MGYGQEASSSSSVRVPHPVPPFTNQASSLSAQAGPAMSRCAYGTPSTNSWRNKPAMMLPAPPPLATFFTSATSESIFGR